MKRKYLKWIDRCLIVSPIYIALCTKERDFKKEIKLLKVNNPPEWITNGVDSSTHFITGKMKKPVSIVCIKKHKDKLGNYGLLIHEAVHIWQEIKNGMDEHNPSSEFEAYAIQAIAQRLIEKLRNK